MILDDINDIKDYWMIDDIEKMIINPHYYGWLMIDNDYWMG